MKKILLLSFVIILNSAGVSAYTPPITTNAKQAIVMDYSTGAILFKKNSNEQMPTSSMAKVMTLYVVFEAIKNGELALNDTIRVSEKAWRMKGSKMFIEVGKEIRVEDLIRGVAVASGNDASVALAEAVAGSEEAFAYKMNEVAKKLGMKNTQFKNASGWPDPEHYSTAYDLALLARGLIRDFPELYKYDSEREFTFNSIRQFNRNLSLGKLDGVDGIKTGYTEDGGYGIMLSGQEGDRRVITVVNGLDSKKSRRSESEKLYLWGMKNFKNKTVIEGGKVIDTAQLRFAKSPEVGVYTPKSLVMTLPKGKNTDIDIQFVPAGIIKAPVLQGQDLGEIKVSYGGELISKLPAKAEKDVKKLNFIQVLFSKLNMWFKSTFLGVNF